MKITSRILALLLALTTAVALNACGGSDSSDAPTKAEFIAQADAICAKGDKDLQATGEEQFGNKAPTQDELIAFAKDAVVPNIEQQAADLRDLTPPEGDEEAISSLVDSLDDGVSELADDPAAALSGGGSSFADANKKAQDYGLTACGDGGA